MILRSNESKMLRALKRTPALSPIESSRWDQLAPFISFIELEKDEILFEAGSPGTELYFVIDGDVELPNGEEVGLQLPDRVDVEQPNTCNR